jgi:glycosyltransferase involved in cell wall biosynthesis
MDDQLMMQEETDPRIRGGRNGNYTTRAEDEAVAVLATRSSAKTCADSGTAAAPELSVIVPAVNAIADLRDCLGALAREAEGVRLEVLVVDRLGADLRRLTAEFPFARVLEVDRAMTIPRMRAYAFRRAAAERIAVIEDHVIVPPGWARALCDAAGDNEAVGGAVENAATGTWLDWAAFLCEYSHTIPPLPSGEAEWLTGNNVVYPRALVERHWEVVDSNRWENALHDAIRRGGGRLVCHPEIVVGHKKHYTFAEYISQRYLYSRSYAGSLAMSRSALERLLRGGLSLALPPLLFYRIVARVLAKRRHRGELARSAPLLAIFVVAWSLGEAVGWWRGPADSLSRVR